MFSPDLVDTSTFRWKDKVFYIVKLKKNYYFYTYFLSFVVKNWKASFFEKKGSETRLKIGQIFKKKKEKKSTNLLFRGVCV